MISTFLFAAAMLVPVGPSEIPSSQEVVFTKPTYEHKLTKKHIQLDKLDLDDRSTWEIAPPDAYKVVAWETGDTVVLTPHSSWLSIYKYDFSLSNLTRGSHIRVNPSSHLGDYHKTSHWIIALDHYSNRLFLNDGSCWKVHSDDTIKEWSVNDFVTYGKNDQFLSTCPYLLINAKLKTYVRAEEF